MNCNKCNIKLSKKEEKEYKDADNIINVLCDECHQEEENQHLYLDEGISDADSGL